jgi:hypothetical protein
MINADSVVKMKANPPYLLIKRVGHLKVFNISINIYRDDASSFAI